MLILKPPMEVWKVQELWSLKMLTAPWREIAEEMKDPRCFTHKRIVVKTPIKKRYDQSTYIKHLESWRVYRYRKKCQRHVLQWMGESTMNLLRNRGRRGRGKEVLWERQGRAQFHLFKQKKFFVCFYYADFSSAPPSLLCWHVGILLNIRHWLALIH